MKWIKLLMAYILFAVGMPFIGTAADVNVNINAPPPPAMEAPPPLEFVKPPDVVVVPSGTRDVYLVPNTVGLYFYGGTWYRLHGDRWYRALLYSGPWASIGISRVPAAVVVVPPDYILALPPGYHRIHYGDFHSQWRDWGRTRHWHSYDWYKDHSTQHWGGKEFHKLPPGHPGERGARDRGPRARVDGWPSNRGVEVKEDGKDPSDKEAGVKKDGKETSDKGAGVKGAGRGSYDKGPRYRGGGLPYRKGPGVEGGGGPYGKGAGAKGGGLPYDKGPGIKSGDRVPGSGIPGGPGTGGGGFGGMKPGGAEPKPDPPGKPE